jgi:hypothetical protein
MNITTTIDQIDAKDAILGVSKTRRITMPKYCLPKEAAKGDTIIIEVLSQAQHAARQKNIAQAILDEILGGNDSKSKK